MSHEHSIADAKPCPICGGTHGQHSDNCGNNRPKDSPKDWPSLCPYCGGKNDAHTAHCPFGPKPKVADVCGYSEPADPLSAVIDRLTDVILRLVDAVNSNNKQAAIQERLAQLEKNMADQLDDIIEDIEESKTLIAGVGVLVTGLKAQLAEALAGVTLPADVKAKIEKIWTAAEANKQALATALTDNTPASPSPA